MRIPIVFGFFATSCGGSDGPRFHGESGCQISVLHPLCAEGRRPTVYRDGDPWHDLCVALDLYHLDSLRSHMFGGLREGVTKVTASYDDADRVTGYEVDCGLDEVLIGTTEWREDGRLERHTGEAYWPGQTTEVTAVYGGDGLATQQLTTVDEDGVTWDREHVFTLDDLGRVVGLEMPNGTYPLFRTFTYDGEDLVSVVSDGMSPEGVPDGGRVDYAYLDDGRLTSEHRTSATDPDFEERNEIEWFSETAGRAQNQDVVVDFEIDSTGRLLRKEVYDLDGRHWATHTWEWDDAGRLVEFWFRGE